MANIGFSGSGPASHALQLGDCLIRLKSFCDAVIGAPEEIRVLIEEIETLNLVLADFEDGEQPGLDIGHEATSRCFQGCKRAVEILNEVVRDVEDKINKRKRLGSVKAVLKRDTIERLRQRLMHAQSMLMLSNNLYLVELQKRNQQTQHDWALAHRQELNQLRIIVTRSNETKTSSTTAQGSCRPMLTEVELSSAAFERSSQTKELESNPMKSNRYVTRRPKLKGRLRVPKWLLGVSRAIDLYEHDSIAGWTFSIQVYNVVPCESPILCMVEEGDVAGIQNLFSIKQASPFDRDMLGFTLLDIAARFHQLEVCKLLIKEGSDPNISVYGFSPLIPTWLSASKRIHDSHSRTNFFDLVRFLAQYVELQDPFEDPISYNALTFFSGDGDTLTWILRASMSTYQDRTLEERVKLFLHMCDQNRGRKRFDVSGILQAILGGSEIDHEVSCIKDEDHYTVLHIMARKFGSSVRIAPRAQDLMPQELLESISSLVLHGSDLNGITSNGTTPMIEIIWSCFFWFNKQANDPSHNSYSSAISHCGHVVVFWLKQLKDLGVDLVKYGEDEKRVWGGTHTQTEFAFWVEIQRAGCMEEGCIYDVRLVNFTYGSEPEDWIFWFTPIMEDYFVQFWDMIDHPERAMPGAWMEENYQYYDDSDEDYY